MPQAEKTKVTRPRSTQRAPTQSRGEQRVAVILDACERLLVAEGESALGMHRIAAESETSIGSLYHFFPGKESLVAALSERHQVAVKELIDAIGRIPDERWLSATADELITMLIRPLLDYIDKNPVLLSLIRLDRMAGRSPADSPVQPLLQGLCIRILSLRLPAASEQSKRAYASTLLGLPLGLVTDLMVDYDKDMRLAVLHEEIPRALTAYLRAIESSA